MANEVRLDIVADDKTAAALTAIQQRLRRISEEQVQIISNQGAYAGGLSKTVGALSAEAAGLERIVSLQREVGSSATAMSRSQSSVTGSFKSAEESARGFGRSVGSLEEGSARAGQSLRHVVAIFDESMRGQRGQMIASVSALVRDSGALRIVISSLASPWAAVAVAGVAALTAIVIEAEQAIRRMNSIRDTQASLAISGYGSNTEQTSAISAEFDTAKEKTNDWAGSIVDLEAEINKLPASVRGVAEVRNAFIAAAQGYAGLEHETPAKAIQGFVRAADSGIAPLAEYITKVRGLQGVTDSSGRTLIELAKAAQTDEEAFRLLSKALIDPGLKKLGTDSSRASHDLESLTVNYDEVTFGGMAAASSMDEYADKLEKAHNALTNADVEAQHMSQSIIAQVGAIELGNVALDKRTKLLQEMFAAEAGAARLAGTPAGDRAQAAARTLEAQVRSAPQDPAENIRHQKAMENIQAEATARRADLKTQEDVARRRLDEARRTETQRLIGTGMAPETASAWAEQSVAVKKAQADLLESQRRVADEGVAVTVAGLKAQVAEEQRGTQERIAKQEQIIAITRQQVSEGRASIQQLKTEEVGLSTLKRQLATQDFQEARSNARAQVELAHGNVSEIIAAYNRMRQAAAQTGQPPATFAKIQQDEVRDLERVQQESFSGAEQHEAALEKIDAARMSAFKAGLQQQVAAHQISKEQMAGFEEQYTATVMGEEERRTEAMTKTVGLTDSEYQKLYEHLADLYAKDAEQQEQAQQRITQAIEAENAKRLKSFTSFFDEAGGGLEKVLTAEITGNQAQRGQAIRSVLTGLIHSAIGGVGTQLSSFAGSKLGPMLGLTTEQSGGGLGSVLGTALMKSVGLYKEPPKTDASLAAEKWKQSADALAKSMQTSVGDPMAKLKQSIDALTQVMGGKASTTGAGVAPTGNVGALVRKYESGGNYNIGYGGADLSNAPLNQYGFPQWAGRMGPAGISHAAGAYQFEPAEWAKYAGPMGIKDFSPASQDRVFQAAYSKEGTQPWSSNTQLMAQLNASTQQAVAVQKQNVTAIQQSAQATQSSAQDFQANAQNVANDNQAVQQHSASMRQASTVTGGSAGGGGFIGGIQQVTGSLGRVIPGLGLFSSILSTTTSVVQGFSAVTSAASAASAAGGVGKGLLGLGLLGIFERGGIVPSAAGGMISGGGLAILHPEEMVLPANISRSVQAAANANIAPSGLNSQTLPSPGAVTTNSGNSSMTYAPQITGRFGSMSRTELDNILRSGGDAFASMARNVMRNNGLFRAA